MKVKAVSAVMLVLLLMGMLFASFRVSETLASPEVRFYVKMPDGYFPGVPPGDLVNGPFPSAIEIWINTSVPIVTWEISLRWDPTVIQYGWELSPGFELFYAEGTFMSDWDAVNWGQGAWFSEGAVDIPGGTITGMMCTINKYTEMPPGKDGPSGSGLLVTLYFTSLSATDYSIIDLIDCYIFTKTTPAIPADIVEDGHYNPPDNPAPDLCIDAIGLIYWIPPIIPLPYVIHIHPPLPFPDVLVYKINATVTNQGTADAGSFNVSFSAFLGGEEVPDLRRKNTTMGLEQGGAKSIQFDFDPHKCGKYTLILTADCDNDVPELDETNNVKTTWVIVTVRGDVDGDFDVDGTDFWMFAGVYPSDPALDPAADFNWDGAVDGNDFWMFTGNYPTL